MDTKEYMLHVAGNIADPKNFGGNYEHADENTDEATLQYRLEGLEELHASMLLRVRCNYTKINRLNSAIMDLHARATKVQKRIDFLKQLKEQRFGA